MRTQLLLGGRIYSPAAPDATAMAVTDGVVTWTGENRTGRALHPGAEEVDLAGAFVAPAFVDTHVHTTALGLSLVGLDLSGSTSRADCLERVRSYVQRSDEAVVWGHGWDDSSWADGGPLRTDELDEVAGGRVVYLARIDAHSAACTTALRRASGLTESTPGFHPQDALTTDAHHAVRSTARSLLSSGARSTARRTALDHAASKGICAVHECGGPDISGRVDFAELMATDHGVEVRGYWGEAVTSAGSARELLDETGAHGLGGDLFVDGSIGSHTAWLTEPYADHGGTGLKFQTVDAIAAHLAACTEAGIQAGFHAIGDGAVSAVVDGLKRTVDSVGGPAVASLGHRIEHLEMVTRPQAELLASWGVIGSMQPVFDDLWGGDGALYSHRLGADRARELNPFALLASAGVSLAFGSDAPVTSIDPWAMLRAAVNHRTPGSAVSPRAAFSAATRGAWRAGGIRDGLAGTLVPGAPASYAVWDAEDLVVRAPADSVARWSTDPRAGVPALPAMEPGAPSPRCVRTVHRGRVIHDA
ncbi:amidohydrolase [Rhodococcus sp. P1Y]|uniref:amidohydrolase n=1 Tax=Rhodococcus sp. P1Y TaxID=1302308 RepID=UPI000EB45EDD|nr:amidohydrolase [Rhodococcus sp. P1Y]AYJ49756.1 amidohydrolase [Rhodococcus sp. P1Y]